MKDIWNLIDQKADFSDDVAQNIIENPYLLPVIFEGISSDTSRVKFRSAKVLKIISEKEPELLYPHMNFLMTLLDTVNNIILWNVLDMIANLTNVDEDHLFDGIFEKYYKFLEEGSMVTAAHVVDNSAKIVVNRPDLENQITKKLLSVDKISLDGECKDILSGKAISVFNNYFYEIEDKNEVITFIENKLTSRRNSTRVKAEEFLKKLNN